MRTSSKVILGAAALLAAFLIVVYIPLKTGSQPEFTEKDAHKMLGDLAAAFARESVDGVLSFAAPDAKIAGRNLRIIHTYLRRAFHSTRSLHVEFRDPVYRREGARVSIDTHAVAGEKPPGSPQMTEQYYSQPVRFVLRRREVPYLGGLITTYEWKIVEVDAPHLPNIDQ